jgi:hypothetical protein
MAGEQQAGHLADNVEAFVLPASAHVVRYGVSTLSGNRKVLSNHLNEKNDTFDVL